MVDEEIQLNGISFPNPLMSVLNNISEFKVLFPAAAAAAKSLQSCPTLGDPIDGSPPGSPVPGILQARILERVAMPSGDPIQVSYVSCIGR